MDETTATAISERTKVDPVAAMHAALAVARDRARPVAQASRNEHHRYKYASAEHVIREARECLAGSGIAVMPSSSTLSEVCGQLCLHRGFLVTHSAGASYPGEISWVVPTKSPTGKSVEVPKEVAKVETTAFAYFLRDLLMMERPPEDDINHYREPPVMTHAAPAVSTGVSAKGQAVIDKLANGADPAAVSAFVGSLADKFAATDDAVVDGFTRADLDALMEAVS